jgi:Rod binding domain-containing protein
MSISSPDALSVAGVGSSGLPAISQANLPEDIRNGNAKAKAAYTEGLEFEQVLVNQLAQQLSATVSSTGTSSDGSDDSSDDSSDQSGTTGLLGGDSSSSAYGSLIPQALTSSIMSGGGLGIAAEIAKSLDPAIGEKS